MAETAHIDTFARDNLPPRSEWPDFLLDRPELQYPERLNCCNGLPRPLGAEGRVAEALPDQPGPQRSHYRRCRSGA
jgi:2-aminobenzoate-CoA ligase